MGHRHRHPMSAPPERQSRPGSNPLHPHCDLWIDQLPSDTSLNFSSRSLLRLASLHRAAQVARFRWQRRHPLPSPRPVPPAEPLTAIQDTSSSSYASLIRPSSAFALSLYQARTRDREQAQDPRQSQSNSTDPYPNLTRFDSTDSDSGTATDEEVIAATLRYTTARNRRVGHRERTRSSSSSVQHEIEWHAWDRLVSDLQIGSDSSDDDEPTSDPQRVSETAAFILDHYFHQDSSSALPSHPDVTLSHPNWSRRYKGPAGDWLKQEFNRARRSRSHTLHQYLGPSGHLTTLAPSEPVLSSFPPLDPEARLPVWNERRTSAGPPPAWGPSAPIQSTDDWSSFSVSNSTPAASATRSSLSGPLARTAEMLEAQLQVARMAHAARTRSQQIVPAPGTTSRTGQRPRSTRDAIAFFGWLRALDGLTTSSASSTTNYPTPPSPGPGTARSEYRPPRSRNGAFNNTASSQAPSGAQGRFDPDGTYPDSQATSVSQPNPDPDGECYMDPAPPSRHNPSRPSEEQARRQRNRVAQVFSDHLDIGNDSPEAAFEGWTLVRSSEYHQPEPSSNDSLMVLDQPVRRTSPGPLNDTNNLSEDRPQLASPRRLPSRQFSRLARRSELLPNPSSGSSSQPANRANILSQVSRSEQWSGSPAERDFQALLAEDHAGPSSTLTSSESSSSSQAMDAQQDVWHVCR